MGSNVVPLGGLLSGGEGSQGEISVEYKSGKPVIGIWISRDRLLCGESGRSLRQNIQRRKIQSFRVAGVKQ